MIKLKEVLALEHKIATLRLGMIKQGKMLNLKDYEDWKVLNTKRNKLLGVVPEVIDIKTRKKVA